MVEGSVDIGGAVVFWSLADGTDRDKLTESFRPLGLESFVPDPRPAAAVLRDALEETLDRITHRCQILETTGGSDRLQDAKRRR